MASGDQRSDFALCANNEQQKALNLVCFLTVIFGALGLSAKYKAAVTVYCTRVKNPIRQPAA